ncbi:MAG: CHAD domain-containing protein [Pseudonocardiales bacterium]|nr:CHAD domain-containing protein [Pseudonocardiales bacterium]MBV9730845.1 CHAD domain-containing protein [Pseudonocardiales bacterium]
MRVAARRMRSALQAFGRVIDRDSTRERMVELKWMAGELAGARDAEVMVKRCAVMLAEMSDELVLGSVAGAVTRLPPAPGAVSFPSQERGDAGTPD